MLAPGALRFALLLAVMPLLLSACHETDNLGGTTDFRLAVETNISAGLVVGDPVTIEVRLVDGLGRFAEQDRDLTLELVRFGGSPLTAAEALNLRNDQSAVGASQADSHPRRFVGNATAAGRFMLRASAPNCSPWMSPPFEVAAGPAAALSFLIAPSDAFSVDRQTLVVEITDTYGNRVDVDGIEVSIAQQVRLSQAGLVTFDEVAVGVPLETAAAAGGSVEVVASSPGLEPAKKSVTVDANVVGGRLTFAHVPLKYDPTFGGSGLDYEGEVPRAIVGAPVLLLAGGKVVAETVSAANGSYRLRWPDVLGPDAVVNVRVLARSDRPKVRVLDNTVDGGGALFALTSDTLVRGDFMAADGGLAGLNLHASSGWTGDRYGEPRAAAPFALLDTVRRATLALVPQWTDTLPLLTIYWSEANQPAAGDAKDGNIGTSHFDLASNALYILGAEDVDTDEYDVPVVVHEWGHFMVARGLLRSDTIGGTHGGGTVLDPRTAFEEGLCNTLAAVGGMTSRPLYADTLGAGQEGGFLENLDRNGSYEFQPGWHAEESVQSAVFDLVDFSGDDGEGWDDVALGWGGLRAALVTAREGDAFLTMFSALDAVELLFPEAGESIGAIRSLHAFTLTEDGGWEANLPLFRAIGPQGDAQVVTLEAAPELSAADGGAHASANRLFTFRGDGRAWEFQVRADRDVDVYLFQDGWPVVRGRSVAPQETVIVTTQPGAFYVGNVRSWAEKDGPFSAAVKIAPQIREKKQPPAWFGGPIHRRSSRIRRLSRPPSPKRIVDGFSPSPVRVRLMPSVRR